jgi:mannosyltransferase
METGPLQASRTQENALAVWEPWLLPALAVPVAILLAYCFRWPLHLDEALLALEARANPVAMVHLLESGSDLPLYPFFLHFWTKLAGDSEAALRLPALPFFLLAAWVAYKIARRASGSGRVGLYAAFFYFASTEAVYQSMLARPYALLGLLSALSTQFFLQAFFSEKGSRGSEWGYLVTNILGSFTHIWYFFVLPAQAIACVCLLPRRRWPRLAVNQVASLVPFGLFWSGVVLRQMHTGVTQWMPRLTFAWVSSALTQFYVGHRVGAAFWAICLLLVVARRRWWEGAAGLMRKPAFAALVVIAALSLAIPLLISVVRPIYYPDRYTIIALPPLAATMGWTLSELASRRWLALWCGVIVMAYGVVAVLLVAGRQPNLSWMGDRLLSVYAGGADRAAAKVVCRTASPGDWLVFTGLSRTTMEYYLERSGCAQTLHLVSFPTSEAAHPFWDWTHADPRILNAKAERLVARLASGEGQAGSAPRIWVFQGTIDDEENVALERVLGRDFPSSRDLPLAGTAFRGVAVYDADPGRAAR